MHDGFEAPRADKTEYIATFPAALTHLLACVNNRGAVMNCGRCNKCLRSMIALQLADALERCPVFAQPLEPGAVEQMDLAEVSVRTVTEGILEELEVRGIEPAIAHALRIALDRVQPQVIERQHREIARLAEVLAST